MPYAWDRLQLFLLARLQLFLLVNGGVDLRGDHTLLATGGETSDLKRQNILSRYTGQYLMGLGYIFVEVELHHMTVGFNIV